MSDRPDLAALLGSRICHDLISPIGAIGNGVELVMMEGTGRTSPEMLLVSESVSSANARLRFFRIAFGQGSLDQRIGRAEIGAILRDIGRGSRMKVEWRIETDLSRNEAKLAFLALLCLETAMAFGGHVTISLENRRLQLVGKAERLRLDAELWDILAGHTASGAEITPALVHFALLTEEAARKMRHLSVELQESRIRISV
ncbi:MAG: histidine phosphotransferase family protein [Pseudorhodobacter sp.]